MDSPHTPAEAEPTQATTSKATRTTALMLGAGTLLTGCAAMISASVSVQAYAQHCSAPTQYSSAVPQPAPSDSARGDLLAAGRTVAGPPARPKAAVARWLAQVHK
ncbi:hypothetical protein GCM10010272_00640 [Streptomyces lateritius]|nr:hypothetical protein GCM10010272_00640 [Streptomyces lateritius]